MIANKKDKEGSGKRVLCIVVFTRILTFSTQSSYWDSFYMGYQTVRECHVSVEASVPVCTAHQEYDQIAVAVVKMGPEELSCDFDDTVDDMMLASTDPDAATQVWSLTQLHLELNFLNKWCLKTKQQHPMASYHFPKPLRGPRGHFDLQEKINENWIF